jgi:hypothetical protein
LLRPVAVRQHYRAAMHADELNAELVWPRVRYHRLRLITGSRVVVTSVTRELTAGEYAVVSSLCV